ncbi:MAG: hypothetical protein E6J51_10715 [Chloroflexi bacterium]|nr:MAG: hypothetical protein E6J51_10715 [Chloroflexota bacterium]
MADPRGTAPSLVLADRGAGDRRRLHGGLRAKSHGSLLRPAARPAGSGPLCPRCGGPVGEWDRARPFGAWQAELHDDDFAHYQSSDALPFLGIALIPGFLALLLYYRALRSTPATLATIAELAYPVAATFIASAPPPYGFNQPLYLPQFIGTGLLIAVILILNYTKQRTPPVVVQEPAAA